MKKVLSNNLIAIFVSVFSVLSFSFVYAGNLMLNTTSGNVGIGTTTPSSKLDVVGDVNTSGSYRIDGSDVIDSNRNWMGAVVSAARGGTGLVSCSINQVLKWNGSTWACSNGTGIAVEGTNGAVEFNSNGILTNDAGFFWDNTYKRLGVGTASPSSVLEVKTAGASDTNLIKVGDNNKSAYISAGNSYFGIATNDGINRFTISQSTGNVGVGTTSPSSLYKFSVVGSSYISNDLTVAGEISGNASSATYATAAGTASSATYASTAGVANSVAWTNVAGRPNVPVNQDGSRYSTNYNSLLTTGFYNGEATPVNAPNPYGQLIVARGMDTGLQIAGGYNSDSLYFRGWWNSGAGFSSWRTVLHNGNFNSYAPTLTGGGASGTWGINISGKAATAGVADSANSVAWTNISGRPSMSGAYQWNWAGQSGQPSWLWGGTDGVNMYVYNPSNFSVSYATSAGNSDTTDGLHVHSGRNNEANKIVRTDASGYIQAGYINSSSGDEANNSSPARVWGTNGTDSYLRTYNTGALSVNYANSAGSATNLSTNRTNWASNGNISAVVGQLSWKNYGNNHTIFDASASTSPDGTSVNNTNAQVAWTPSYPTLMGWNGASTYGVRVDSSRVADYASSAGVANSVAWANVSGKPNMSANNYQWNWAGQGGQPSWLWGGTDGGNMYVYNPSNFSVNYATSASQLNTTSGDTDYKLVFVDGYPDMYGRVKMKYTGPTTTKNKPLLKIFDTYVDLPVILTNNQTYDIAVGAADRVKGYPTNCEYAGATLVWDGSSFKCNGGTSTFSDFEAGYCSLLGCNLTGWSVNGSAGYSSNFGLVSNSINDSQYTDFSFTVPYGYSSISFNYNVSGETSCDHLLVIVDGNTLFSSNSNSDTWNSSSVSFSSSSSHTVIFRYQKDGSVSNNRDNVYVDNIRIN